MPDRSRTSTTCDRGTDPTVGSVVDQLVQLRGVLDVMQDDLYGQRSVGVFDCSVGQQVRHVLDHVSCFLAGVESGHLDYDDRRRETTIETSRRAALEAITRLTEQMRAVDSRAFSKPATVSVLFDPDDPASVTRSSIHRELAFVLSHTVHHNAIIEAMARMLDVTVPEAFGYAPSTVAYLDSR